MNEKERNLVKKYCMKEFNLLEERYPAGKILSKSQLDKYISTSQNCTSCSLPRILYTHKKEGYYKKRLF